MLVKDHWYLRIMQLGFSIQLLNVNAHKIAMISSET
jgi:hypothetical protein